MSTTHFGAVLGLVFGVIWVFANFWAAVGVALLTAIGFIIALVLEGRLDLTDYLGHRDH